MSLDIVWIASEDLSTAGKDDALASLIFCRPKDVVGPADIGVQQGWIELGLRIGGGSQMKTISISRHTCWQASRSATSSAQTSCPSEMAETREGVSRISADLRN